MLTVFNVKQGDSMLLEGMSGKTCCFDNEPLLIDCGLQKARVFAKLGTTPVRLRVLVTHADRDHIGGLVDVIRNHNVTRLYVPRYLPEVQRIEDYLRKKRLPANPSILAATHGTRRIEIAEGDRLCRHAFVMNPPMAAGNALSGVQSIRVSVDDVTAAVEYLRDVGLQLDAGEISGYMPPPISSAPERALGVQRRGVRARQDFFRGFFVRLAQLIRNEGGGLVLDSPRRDFQSVRNLSTDAIVATTFRLTANQVSVVFRYDGLSSFLFTGDADCATFNRISAAKHRLRADYLKVPHHGSRHNLDAATLGAINPVYAVVSHGNAKFGRDPDSHPHQQTLNMLAGHRGLTSYFTNDVIKSGKKVAKKTLGRATGLLHFK